MEMSEKYISLCKNEEVQNLCKWNSGDRFLAMPQELFVFLEEISTAGGEEICKVWVPNYNSNFELEKKNLLWVPNMSQVISAIRAVPAPVKKMTLEYSEGNWSCTLHFSGKKPASAPIVNSAKTGKTACIKTLVQAIKTIRK